MKKDWTIKKLDEICDVITDFVAAGSFADLRKNVVYNEHPDFAQLVRTTDLKHNFNNSGFVYVSEDAFNYLYRVNLNEDSIILPNVGVNCGEVYYITSDMLPYKNNVLGPNAVLARSHKHCNKYLYYCFLSSNLQFQISNITSKMAQPKFNKTALKLVQLPLPPLEEQKRIVAVLDKKFAQIETLKTAAEKNLQNTKQLFKAELEKAFSETDFQKIQLREKAILVTKGSSPSWQGIHYVDSGVLFVTSENVRENYIDIDKQKYLETKFNEIQKRSILKKNDILINIVGASIGRAAIFDLDIPNANINQAVALVRLNDDIDKKFLSLFLNSDLAMNQYNDVKKDTARANLSLENINNLEIPLPPLEEQKRIVVHLDSLSAKVHQLEEIYTKQLADCDELKQSLLQKAFEGEL